MSCCLIVAFYYGKDRTYEIDCDKYAKAHLQCLSKYKHSLSKIIFAIAENDRKETEIKEKDGITYVYRENKGLSFGSWIECYKLFNNFDYYILGEDDYLFVKDNFDRILIREYNRLKVDYVVTYSQIKEPSIFFKDISTIGITSNSSLKKLQYSDFIPNNDFNGKCKNMKVFLHGIGYKQPVGYDYSFFPYFNTNKTITLYDYDSSKTYLENLNRALLCPYQMLDENCNVTQSKIEKINR